MCNENGELKEINALVQIDVENFTDEDREKLFQIEKLFLELGISFDTGLGFKKRDWEWDWSLQGPIKVYCMGFKDEDKSSD
jgi:hypothetical protein